MVDVIVLNSDKEYHIKNISDNLNLNSNIDTLGAELTLTTTINYTFSEGDIIILKSKDKEIFRGIIIDFETNTISTNDYKSCDFAFYLNKNQVFYKFSKQSASECIKKLLKDFNIPIGSIDNISFSISKIYNGKTVSDVIKDILEQVKENTGTEYYFEMIQGKFNLFNKNSLVAQYEVNNNTIITPPTLSRSIEELKNTIVITSNSDENATILYTVKDDSSISKYGKLQLIHSIGDDEKSRKNTIASNLLKENNKASNTLKFDVVGDFNLMPCRIIKVSLDRIKGNYRIVNVSHALKSGVHITSLDLEVV